jgi:hypothetical protein
MIGQCLMDDNESVFLRGCFFEFGGDLLSLFELLGKVIPNPLGVEIKERPARLEVLDEDLTQRIGAGPARGEHRQGARGLSDHRDDLDHAGERAGRRNRHKAADQRRDDAFGPVFLKIHPIEF